MAGMRSNSEIANIVTIAGGNSDLSPMKAQSWSFGFTFARRAAFNLNLSATYWQSRLRDRVSPFLLQTLLIHDEVFADRVMRDRPTESDIAAGRPGVLRSLDVRPANVGTLGASGIDTVITAQFDTRFGRFSPAISTTWMDQFTVTDFPGIAPVERVGLASVFGTIPDWYAIGALGWSGAVWSATATARFLSSYRDFNVLRNQVNGRRVPSQTILDAQVSLSLDGQVEAESAWSGFRLTAGITNLLDKRPAFAEVGIDQGFDVSQGDLKGRFGYARLTKEF